jgi:hypothetical protein
LDYSRNGNFHDDVYETLKEPTDYEPWRVNSLLEKNHSREDLLETLVKVLKLCVELRWKTNTVKIAGPSRPRSPNASGISASCHNFIEA